MSIESMIPSNCLILCHPLLFLPSIFPSNREQSKIFTSGGQSIEVLASASVLPMNIQGWFPLVLTGLISLKSKGLSRVFSNITVQMDQFFSTQLLYSSTLTSIHDYWKNHIMKMQKWFENHGRRSLYLEEELGRLPWREGILVGSGRMFGFGVGILLIEK